MPLRQKEQEESEEMKELGERKRLLHFYYESIGAKDAIPKLWGADSYKELDDFTRSNGIRYDRFILRYMRNIDEVKAFLALSEGDRALFIAMLKYEDALVKGNFSYASKQEALLADYSKLLGGLDDTLKTVLARALGYVYEKDVNLESVFAASETAMRKEYFSGAFSSYMKASFDTVITVQGMKNKGLIECSEEADDYVHGVLKNELGADDAAEAYEKLYGKEFTMGGEKAEEQAFFLAHMGDKKTGIPMIGPIIDLFSDDFRDPLMLLCAVRMGKARKYAEEGRFDKAVKELNKLQEELVLLSKFTFYGKTTGYDAGFSIGAYTSLNATLSKNRGGIPAAKVGVTGTESPEEAVLANAALGPFALSGGPFFNAREGDWQYGVRLGFGDAYFDVVNKRFTLGFFALEKGEFELVAPIWFIGAMYGINAAKVIAPIFLDQRYDLSPASANRLQFLSEFMSGVLGVPLLSPTRTAVETVDFALPEYLGIASEKMNDEYALYLIQHAEKQFAMGTQDNLTMAINYLDAVIEADGVSDEVKTIAKERRALYKLYHWAFFPAYEFGAESESAELYGKALEKCEKYYKKFSSGKKLTDSEFDDFLKNYYMLSSYMVVSARGIDAVSHDLPVKNEEDLSRFTTAISKGAYLIARTDKTGLSDGEMILLYGIKSNADAFDPQLMRMRLLTMADNGAISIKGDRAEAVDSALDIMVGSNYDASKEMRAPVSGLSMNLSIFAKEFDEIRIGALVESSKPGYTKRFFKSVWEGSSLQDPSMWAPLSFVLGASGKDGIPTVLRAFAKADVSKKELLERLDNEVKRIDEVMGQCDELADDAIGKSDLEKFKDASGNDSLPGSKEYSETYTRIYALLKEAKDCEDAARLREIYAELNSLLLQLKGLAQHEFILGTISKSERTAALEMEELISTYSSKVKDKANYLIYKKELQSMKENAEEAARQASEKGFEIWGAVPKKTAK